MPLQYSVPAFMKNWDSIFKISKSFTSYRSYKFNKSDSSIFALEIGLEWAKNRRESNQQEVLKKRQQVGPKRYGKNGREIRG